MKTNILITAHSEKGTRERNEDFYSVQTNKNGQVLAIICDGIGGDEDSQIASKTVVLNFESLFKKKKKIINFVSFYNTVLKKTLKIINAKSKKNSKMGTTVCVVLITGNKAEMANIGDSRIYYFNNANKE
jgi:protein phosphatase